MTTKKQLTYLEIDVDYCALTHNVAPCRAALAGEFVAYYDADFDDGTLHSWTASNGSSLLATPDGAYYRHLGAGDANMNISGISIPCGAQTKIKIEVEFLVAGTWEGLLL